jgi:penicillin-binding protein 2
MNRRKIYRENYFLGIIAVLFGLLFFSLFKIQVIDGDTYREVAEKNYFRVIYKPAKRGIIYDKNFHPLVENIPSFAVYLDMTKLQDKEEVAEFLSQNLLLTQDTILDIIYKNRFRKFAPVLLDEDVELATAIKLEENHHKFPEIIVQAESRRHYLGNSHFIGYVGKISQEEYENLKSQGYDRTDYIGKVGLEGYYESSLKGKKGYDVVQVDALGNNLGLAKGDLSRTPLPGKDLVLTIDIDLQNELKKLLPPDSSCAGIVMDCRTGGILAAVSTPSYDPNKFVSGMESAYWNKLLEDKHKPLLIKYSQATYPPGSTFKLVVALYILEKELVNPEEILVDCKGGIEYGGRFFQCWKQGGHGKVNLLDAIRESCNSYFFTIGKTIDLNDFSSFVKACELTSPTGIDLAGGERSGFFPTSSWYDENYGKFGWTRGHILNLMIGQGEVLLTPFALARFYAAIANDGLLVQPHFADYFIVDGKREKLSFSQTHIPIKPEICAFLREALDAAVNAPGRTGGLARIAGVRVGGKTGSAETYQGNTHAWFTAIAPIDNPEIVVVVFIENGGSGADMPARITGQILAHYFETNPLLTY